MAEEHRETNQSFYDRISHAYDLIADAGEHESLLEKTYIWMHQHFPHIVDCQPIDVAGLVAAAKFEIRQEIEMEIWSMPVRAVVAFRT